jgi:hypothetical protein
VAYTIVDTKRMADAVVTTVLAQINGIAAVYRGRLIAR